MMKRYGPLTACALIAAGTAFVAGNAHAVIKERVFAGSATNFCQSALPVFDVQIRKRPLAVQNEGTTNAFVTCSLTSQDEIKLASIYFASDSAATLTCTGVLSPLVDGPATYVVKDVQLAGAGATNQIVLRPTDFGAPNDTVSMQGSSINISCNLAPGMGVRDSFVVSREDIGS